MATINFTESGKWFDEDLVKEQLLSLNKAPDIIFQTRLDNFVLFLTNAEPTDVYRFVSLQDAGIWLLDNGFDSEHVSMTDEMRAAMLLTEV